MKTWLVATGRRSRPAGREPWLHQQGKSSWWVPMGGRSIPTQAAEMICRLNPGECVELRAGE